MPLWGWIGMGAISALVIIVVLVIPAAVGSLGNRLDLLEQYLQTYRGEMHAIGERVTACQNILAIEPEERQSNRDDWLAFPTRRRIDSGDYEVCPRCDYCKRKNQICTRCALYCPQPGQDREGRQKRGEERDGR